LNDLKIDGGNGYVKYYYGANSTPTA
jgi:hypothetical protein